MNIFWITFESTFVAILRIALVCIGAGLLVRKNIITRSHIESLSTVMIRVLLPCLIFSKIISAFNPKTFPIWWILPLTACGMVLTGLLAAWLAFRREMPSKRNMLPLASIQNAGYLVLPLGSVLYAETFDKFALYCFLYNLGITPFLWGIGKYFVTGDTQENFTWKRLITPPLIANLLALTMVFTHTRSFIPETILGSVTLLGSAAVPVATFILGATLGSISLSKLPPITDTLKVILIKLFLIPLITIWVLYISGCKSSYPLLTGFLMLEAATPAATGFIIQIRSYGGDEQKIGSIMLASYLICMVTIPFWMAIWNIMG